MPQQFQYNADVFSDLRLFVLLDKNMGVQYENCN